MGLHIGKGWYGMWGYGSPTAKAVLVVDGVVIVTDGSWTAGMSPVLMDSEYNGVTYGAPACCRTRHSVHCQSRERLSLRSGRRAQRDCRLGYGCVCCLLNMDCSSYKWSAKARQHHLVVCQFRPYRSHAQFHGQVDAGTQPWCICLRFHAGDIDTNQCPNTVTIHDS